MIKEHKLNRFSPSMIIDYLNCPMLFYYRYIAKIYLPQKQIHLLFGGAIHDAIEGIYNKQEPYDIFKKRFVKRKLLDEEKKDHKEYIGLGNEMLKNYIDIHETLVNLYKLKKGKSELYIRRYLTNPLTNEKSTLPISGRIDRLTDNGIIVEYKTSKRKWNTKEMNYKTQTLLYNLWYYSEYGVLPTDTIYIILLKKYKNVGRGETYQVLNKHCTINDLASTFDEVEIIINKINNGEFSRPLGYHPTWCDCHRYEEALNFNK